MANPNGTFSDSKIGLNISQSPRFASSEINTTTPFFFLPFELSSHPFKSCIFDVVSANCLVSRESTSLTSVTSISCIFSHFSPSYRYTYDIPSGSASRTILVSPTSALVGKSAAVSTGVFHTNPVTTLPILSPKPSIILQFSLILLRSSSVQFDPVLLSFIHYRPPLFVVETEIPRRFNRSILPNIIPAGRNRYIPPVRLPKRLQSVICNRCPIYNEIARHAFRYLEYVPCR